MGSPQVDALNELVEKVKRMSKKPTLEMDIRKVLDQCIEDVERHSIYVENGVFNYNFAGVAIVLEQVSVIYGKKVDLLWEFLLNYQKRLLKFHMEESKVVAGEKAIEERRQRFKRQRKKPPETPQPVVEKPNTSLTPNYEYDFDKLVAEISQDFDEDKEFSLEQSTRKFFDGLPIHEEEVVRPAYHRPLYLPTKFPITFNGKYFCDNGDLLSNYISFEVCDFERQKRYDRGENVDTFGLDIQDDLVQDYLHETGLKYSKLTDEQKNDMEQYVYQKLLEKMPLQQRCRRLCPRRSSIMLTRLSDDVMQHYLKKDRISTEETSDDSVNRDLGEGTSRSGQEIETAQTTTTTTSITTTTTTTLENREEINAITTKEEETATRKSIDSRRSTITVKANDIEDERHVDANRESLVCLDVLRRNSDEGYCSFVSSDALSKSDGDVNDAGDFNVNKNERNISKSKLRVSERTIEEEEVHRVKHASDKLKRQKCMMDVEEGAPRRKRLKRSDLLRLRKVITRPLGEYDIFYYENYRTQVGEGELVMTNYLRAIYRERSKILLVRNVITTSLNRFEHFFYRNYIPTKDEGLLIAPPFSDDLSIEDDHVDSGHNFLYHDLPACSGETTNARSLNDSGIVEDISVDNALAVPGTSREFPVLGASTPNDEVAPVRLIDFFNTVSSSAPNEIDTSAILEAHRQRQIANAKLAEWKSEIDDTLSKRDAKDFDIHLYETRILAKIPNDCAVGVKEVMGGNKATEIARLFAATLQLANNSNVEFVNRKPGELGNEDLGLRLLSRDRHHLQLESYEAPSLGERAAAIERMRTVQRERGQASTSIGRVPHKKRRTFAT